MLLVNKVKPNDVVTLKLYSGEEVIGKLLSVDDQNVTIAKPIILAPNPSQPGTVVAAPFIATAENNSEIEITKSHVTSMIKTNQHFTSQYIEITTGIKLAKGNLPPLAANT